MYTECAFGCLAFMWSVRLPLCTTCVVWLWFHLGTFDIFVLDPVSDFSMLLLMLRVQWWYDEPLKLCLLLLSAALVIAHHHFGLLAAGGHVRTGRRGRVQGQWHVIGSRGVEVAAVAQWESSAPVSSGGGWCDGAGGVGLGFGVWRVMVVG